MKKVNLLIVLLAIMIGCSKEDRPTAQKHSKINQPEKWLKESIEIHNFKNAKLINQIIRVPLINIKNVAIENGVVDVQMYYDDSNAEFEQSEVYVTGVKIILTHILQLSKEEQIDSVNIKSYSKENRLMLIATYNKVGLNKIFKNREYNVVHAAELFNGCLII